MVAGWRAKFGRALDVLLHAAGRRCQLCAAVARDVEEFPLCRTCSPLLAPRLGGYCPRCGACYADASLPAYECLACRQSPPLWNALVFHGPYAGALRELVHRHKFNHDHGAELLLNHLMRQSWELRGLPRPDCVVPVPMRPRMLVRRGFNQSAELARMLARFLSVPVMPDGLLKVRDTRTQSSLGRTERRRNVAEAFAASPQLEGRQVVLVDDVMTTGATVTSCVRACLDSGAAKVDVFVLARAL